MTEIEDILREVTAESVPVFQQDYISTGYVNSGGSLESIKALDNKIVAHVSVSTLVFGRAPSAKYPPFGYVKDTDTPTSLMQWTMDKFGVTGSKARGLSFVIARTIKEKGNRVHRGLAPPIPTEGTLNKADEVAFRLVNEIVTNTIKENEL